MTDARQTNSIDKLIGVRVRQRRLTLGLSQERLAELIGVTFQQVQKYEKGVNRIAAGRLFDIAEALDAPVTFFYDGIVDKLKDQSSEPAAEKVLATPEGQKLLALFAAIEDPKIRKRILELAIAVAADA